MRLRSISLILLASVMFCSCLRKSDRPSEPSVYLESSGNKNTDEDWETVSCLFYDLRITKEDRQYVEDIKEVLTGFHEKFSGFAELPEDSSIMDSRITVYLYPSTSNKVHIGRASMSGSVQHKENRAYYQGEITMPGPNAYDSYSGNSRTSVNHPQNLEVFYQTLVHEITPIYLCLLNPENQFYYTTPGWFHQGIETYFGVFYSIDYWKEDGLQYFIDRLTTHPNCIDTSFGLNVTHQYVDGFLLCTFLSETYGEEILKNIILDDEKSFGIRMAKHTKEEFATFCKRIQMWKASKLQTREHKVPGF